MLQEIFLGHFSPTGGTRRTANILAQALAERVVELDLSVEAVPKTEFGEHDVVILAAPVFGGRTPAAMLDNVKMLQGHNTKAILVAVYGNRAYDDALLELSDVASAQGFKVVAALGLIAEHSLLRTVASGRPDIADEAEIKEFALQILDKLKLSETAELVIPGKRPYKEWQPMQLMFDIADSCNECGMCERLCPTKAIPSDAVQSLLSGKCTVCMRCVVICPKQARSLPKQVQAGLEERLGALKNVRRNNELLV